MKLIVDLICVEQDYTGKEMCIRDRLQPLGIDRRDGAIARQCNANGLAQAVHAVGGVHTLSLIHISETPCPSRSWTNAWRQTVCCWAP